MGSDKKLKILFAIGRLSVGGAEKLLVKQLPIVNREKFDPYLLTLFLEQKDSFADQIKLNGNHWKKLDFRSLFDLKSWLDLYKFLKKENFDAVVTSLFSANLMVRIVAVFLRVPVIISYEHNFYPNKRRWQIWADRLLAKWTDKIIIDADAVRKFTAEQEKISIEKFLTMYIPPLLDAAEARDTDLVRRELGIPPEAKIILTVSRLVEEKGHRYLVEAAKEVLKEFPNAYFVIVGWGNQEESLKSQVSSGGGSSSGGEGVKLKDRVILPGRMDIQEVLPLADIYAEPAVMIDLPIAIMEAMRMGKPIVASAIGEIPLFVKDGKTGFLVPPSNSAALAEKIIHLLKNEDLRKRFGDSAEQAVRKYSLGEYESRFEDLVIKLSGK